MRHPQPSLTPNLRELASHHAKQLRHAAAGRFSFRCLALTAIGIFVAAPNVNSPKQSRQGARAFHVIGHPPKSVSFETYTTFVQHCRRTPNHHRRQWEPRFNNAARLTAKQPMLLAQRLQSELTLLTTVTVTFTPSPGSRHRSPAGHARSQRAWFRPRTQSLRVHPTNGNRFTQVVCPRTPPAKRVLHAARRSRSRLLDGRKHFAAPPASVHLFLTWPVFRMCSKLWSRSSHSYCSCTHHPCRLAILANRISIAWTAAASALLIRQRGFRGDYSSSVGRCVETNAVSKNRPHVQQLLRNPRLQKPPDRSRPTRHLRQRPTAQ